MTWIPWWAPVLAIASTVAITLGFVAWFELDRRRKELDPGLGESDG